MDISDLNSEEIEESCRKDFKFEKVTKGKGDKLYVKCKVCNNSFSSWTDKKTLHE